MSRARVLFFFLVSALFNLNGFAQGTVFAYQGRLNDGGSPATGTYDFTFTLYDSTNQPGNVLSGTITNLSVPVASGLFTVNLDFGDAFNGTALWLQIAVRTNGAVDFTTLTPRQPLTPVPYAIFSGSATNLVGALSTANIAPLTSLINTSSNGLYSSLSSAESTSLAGSTNSGIINSNEYARLNSFPNTFNMICPTPPIVLNTWWGGEIGDYVTTNTMTYLATNGVLAMARKYNTPFYYVQDDYWMDHTNVPNGILQPDPRLWPHGMKVVADYAHGLGIKFGLYPQSAGWEIFPTNLYGNATNFLAWGIDYLKFELGSVQGPTEDAYLADTLLYPFWTNSHPVFVESGCAAWSPLYVGLVQAPRCVINGDVYDYYNLLCMVDYTRTFSTFTIGPGRGIFPCIDYVSRYLTPDQEKEHWTAEAMIPALWAFSFNTNELRLFPDCMLGLTNEDVFSINQDPLVSPGFLALSNQLVNVYERRCVSNTFAVSIENRNSFATNYTLWFTNLPSVPESNLILDCWAHTNCAATGSFTITVNPYSAALLRLSPESSASNIITVNWPESVVTSTAVNGIQTIGYSPIDFDASNYIARAGITNNPSEMLAAAVAVSLGKQHGWWNNWDAIYLFRGSTPNSTAQNLISTNYNIVWHTNGMTFSWTGVSGDGVNSYGDTGFNPATAVNPRFSADSASFFIYNRTPFPTGTGNVNAFLGVAGTLNAGLYCNNSSDSLGLFGINASVTFDNVNVAVEPDSHNFSGYILANRYAPNGQTTFHDQSTGNTIDSNVAAGLPSGDFYIFAANSGGSMSYPTACNLSLAGFGAGMTPSQWQVFQSDMKTVMSILGL